MVDANIQASTSRAVQRVGQPVTFQRVVGYAPNAVTFSAAVVAVIHGVTPDTVAARGTGYGSAQIGGMSQDERQFLVMNADLAALGFPLPVQKGDKIIIGATGEKLNITRVDAAKRYIAGATEGFGTGVA